MFLKPITLQCICKVVFGLLNNTSISIKYYELRMCLPILEIKSRQQSNPNIKRILNKQPIVRYRPKSDLALEVMCTRCLIECDNRFGSIRKLIGRLLRIIDSISSLR